MDHCDKLDFKGLAQVAVHHPIVKEFIPAPLFSPGSDNVKPITNHLWSLTLNVPTTTNSPTVSKTGGVHAFDVVARILKDDKLNRKAPTGMEFVNGHKELFIRFYAPVRTYVEEWTIDLNQPGELERKMEEVIWLNSLIYGVGSLTSTGPKADFFMYVTSHATNVAQADSHNG